MSPSSSRHRPRRRAHPKLLSQPPSLRRDLELRRAYPRMLFLWPSPVTSTLIIQPIAMAASSLKRHHSKSLSLASLWPDGLSPDGAKNHPHRLRGGRAMLIRANIVGPRLASPPSRRIKPDTENSRSARLYRQFSFCCRRRSLACSCPQRLIFAAISIAQYVR